MTVPDAVAVSDCAAVAELEASGVVRCESNC